MRKLLFFLFFFLLCAALDAAPSLRLAHTLTLSDGRVITATLVGDEDFHCWLSEEGFVIEKSAEGYVLTSRTMQDMRSAVLDARSLAVPRHSASQGTAALRAQGSPRIAVILAEFPDMPFRYGQGDEQQLRDSISLFFNGHRNGQYYRGAGSRGSVAEYFRDQSYGQFFPEFKVLPLVTVANGHDYYGSHRTTYAKEAIGLVAALPEIDWSEFDSDNDGKIDMMFLVHPGEGQETSSDDTDIWSYEQASTMTIGGVTFACHAVCPELMRGEINSIGVFCHELSHALGLPDMYDTNYKAQGMDVWSLMDYGEHFPSGKCPVAYTAYERDFMGWRSLVTLSPTESCTLDLTSLSVDGVGYKIENQGYPDEYYVLENRSRYGWDTLLCKNLGSGLMVSHIDYDRSAWSSNKVNTVIDHQRITIIPANNHFVQANDLNSNQWRSELKGHLYPCHNADFWGELGNDELSNTSTPAATLFNANSDGSYLMNVSLLQIEVDEHGNSHLYYDPSPSALPCITTTEQELVEYYDIRGQRLSRQPRQGIYIQREPRQGGVIRIWKD